MADPKKTVECILQLLNLVNLLRNIQETLNYENL